VGLFDGRPPVTCLPTFPMCRRTKLTHLSVHDSRDGVSDHTTSPSPPSSLTDVHRDDVSEHTSSPSSPSSLTHVHRCIGSHNATRQTLSTSAKLTSLSMYDSRNDATQCM
jgi:hypothetical protein